MKTWLAKKLSSVATGWALFFVLVAASFTFITFMDIKGVEANKTEWGIDTPLRCTFKDQGSIVQDVRTSLQEVTVECSNLSRRIMVSQLVSYNPTTKVWVNKRTGEVWFADGHPGGGNNAVDKQPGMGTLWPLLLVLLIPLSGFIAAMIGMKIGDWQRKQLKSVAVVHC